jgi:hypothetical protein
VKIAKADGTEEVLKADTVILAAGLTPNEAIRSADAVGDNVKPGRIADATYSAYAAVRNAE